MRIIESTLPGELIRLVTHVFEKSKGGRDTRAIGIEEPSTAQTPPRGTIACSTLGTVEWTSFIIAATVEWYHSKSEIDR